MDEDLKIVLTSELEADEAASAKRISAQLPNIAKQINAQSRIKVGVSLDSTNIQGEAQKITQQVSRAVKTIDVGVPLNLDQSSINKIKNALDGLNVRDDIAKSMTQQLDKMGIQIDQISGKWDAIKNSEEKALSVAIRGTDQMGRTVSYMGTYNEAMGQLEQKAISVTENLERQRVAEERLAAQAKIDNDARVAYLKEQKSELDKMYASYTDPNAAKPIVYSEDLDKVKQGYLGVIDTIVDLGNTQGRISAEVKADLESQITSFGMLAKQIQNAEYVATSLRTKTTKDVNAEQVQNLTEYENKLRSSGKLTDEFKNRIAELRTQLANAFDSSSLTDYLNQFDRLKSEVKSFDSQISAINAGYKKLIEANNAVTATHGKMAGVDQNSAEYERLNQLLMIQKAHQEEICAEIEEQVAGNRELLQYSSQYKEYMYSSATAAAKLAVEEGKVSDAASAVKASLEPFPAQIQNIEAKLKSLNNAPDDLVDKVGTLRKLLDGVKNAKTADETNNAFETLKKTVSECNKEISQLNGANNADLRLFRNTEGIQKAKADLETIGRQWSALKNDDGLNDQFRKLGISLQAVERGEKDLRAWTAEFGRFKSEVKAAGKNVMSLGDTIKNNLSKVTEWASATTILFGAFRKIKDAAEVVRELDTAMIDLRKTTDETEASYQKFYYSANETAKSLGVATKEVIAQTAEWSRLGFSLSESAEMAKNSAIFTAISPELNMEESTDGLISIMKAFGIETDEVLDGVISKINKLGNELAISNKDIVEVMTRSSSAMKAANNSFEQTAALGVAAVEITRNSEQAGNALRSMSMRIRGKSSNAPYVQKCA